MSARVYVRKFDWDDARRLHGEGVTVRDLAGRFGVTWNAVYRVVTPGMLEREANYSREWQRSGRCDDCGGPMNRLSRSQGSTRCLVCAGKARVTTARETELKCVTCAQWLPDSEFPHNMAAPEHRRGRHSQCRSCNTASKRKWRAENREHQRAYDRDRKRRERAAA